jgi:Tol biopolymer transport system component
VYESRSPSGLFRIAVDRSEEPEVITDDQWFQPYSYSPDGSLLLLGRIEPLTGWDIWILSAEESGPKPFVQTKASEYHAKFSPDGRWFVYHSDLDGELHVYVEPYPRTGERFRASADPGSEPVWSPDGAELFYRNVYGRQMMAVAIQTEPTFSAETPRPLFEGRESC